MRPEKNSLDLNNLPEDFSNRDGKQVIDDSSSASGYRKKKGGAKEGKDECGKVYECRFCSLKFCKSQALGGHMNRHRQERETETLSRARQLVFGNDNPAAQVPSHLGCHPIAAGSYHTAGHIGDPFRSVHPPRLFTGSSTIIPPPQPPPYSYPSPSRLTSYCTQYPPPHPMNEYYVGHVLTSRSSHSHSQYPHQNLNYMGAPVGSNYTCIGAPVRGHGFMAGSSRGSSADLSGASSGGRDGSLRNQEEGLNWVPPF
ncbi:zinc finger protein JAGGED-like [Mangifera indica]|uniref:zinc finger protein JAGGED-like n=1 Tax=Mangifera indica TaxID=29780 RepID=UPI001CFB6AAA|nr:zinc finger protein JAGGED-like [Mangifera indica]